MMEKTYEGDFNALPAWAQKKIRSLETELDPYSHPKVGEPNTFVDPYIFHDFNRERQGRPVGVNRPIRFYLNDGVTEFVEVRVNRNKTSAHIEGSRPLIYIPTSAYGSNIEMDQS